MFHVNALSWEKHLWLTAEYKFVSVLSDGDEVGVSGSPLKGTQSVF